MAPAKPRRYRRLALTLLVAGLVGGFGWLSPSGDGSTAGRRFDAVARALSPSLRELDRRRRALAVRIVESPLLLVCPADTQTGFHSRMHRNLPAPEWVQVDLGDQHDIDAVALIPALAVTGESDRVAYGFPSRFHVDVASDPTFNDALTVLDCSDSDFADPGPLPVFAPCPGTRGRYVRVTATRLTPMNGLRFLALAELLVLHGNLDVAVGKTVTSSSSINNPPTWSPTYLVDGRSPLGAPIGNGRSRLNGYHSGIEPVPDVVKWVEVDLGRPYRLDEVRLIPALPRDFPGRVGFGFPVRFRLEAADGPDLSGATMLLDATAADVPNPGPSPVVVPAAGVTARYVRLTATRLWERTGDFAFALAELQVYADGVNVARGAAVAAADSVERGLWSRAALVDGFASHGELIELPDWLRGLADRRVAQRELHELDAEWTRRAGELIAALALGFGLVVITGLLLGTALSWRARRRRRRELEALRERIARDLHDEIGSNLGSIALLSQLARSHGTDGADGVDAELEQIGRIARQTADSMRDIVWLLSVESQAPADLIGRFRETAAGLLAAVDWSFEVEPGALPTPPTLEFKRQTFLVLKEALHNAVRHGHPRRVTVRLARPASFVLEVRDDGQGFDPDRSSAGTGLKSMRARAAVLGGTLEVESGPGKGCVVRLVVPVR